MVQAFLCCLSECFCSLVFLIHIILFCQVKDRQKKKQTKGIRVDAEGDASLEDLTNTAASQATGNEESPDVERSKSNNKKVLKLFCIQLL